VKTLRTKKEVDRKLKELKGALSSFAYFGDRDGAKETSRYIRILEKFLEDGMDIAKIEMEQNSKRGIHIIPEEWEALQWLKGERDEL